MDALSLYPTHRIPVGLPVYDANGEKLGRVRYADGVALLVSHGWLFHHDDEIPLREVDRYQDGKLILRRTKAEVFGRAA